MRAAETRSQRTVAAVVLAGRKDIQHSDDTEALLLRQAPWLCRYHPLSFEAAVTVAQLAYPTMAATLVGAWHKTKQLNAVLLVDNGGA